MLNDRLGCCVVSAIGHLLGVFSANALEPLIDLTDEQIKILYGMLSGYDENAPLDTNGNNPTDQGIDEVTALNFWQNFGAPKGSNEIAGWMQVNAANPIEVRTAIWLFENLLYGVDLPDAYIDPAPEESGFIWDVAGPSNPDNGHAFISAAYDESGCKIDTWAMEGTMTDAANSKYAVPAAGGALYTVFTYQSIIKATGKAQNGFAGASLVADFNAMGGNIKNLLAV